MEGFLADLSGAFTFVLNVAAGGGDVRVANEAGDVGEVEGAGGVKVRDDRSTAGVCPKTGRVESSLHGCGTDRSVDVLAKHWAAVGVGEDEVDLLALIDRRRELDRQRGVGRVPALQSFDNRRRKHLAT